jgi:hypothetical protein
MADYLVFQTEAEAKTALEAIYSNMVEAVDSPDLLDVATGQVVPKDELTPDEAVQVNAGNRHFPVFGKNALTGVKDTINGRTTAWDVARQTLQGKWVFQKPEDALLNGVFGYTVKPYDPAWFPAPSLQS